MPSRYSHFITVVLTCVYVFVSELRPGSVPDRGRFPTGVAKTILMALAANVGS
jgi:hypothetical protein